MSTKLNSQTGFTLIETIIALVVTGLITSICTFSLLKLLDFNHMSQTIATFRNDLHLIRQQNMIPGSQKLQIRISSNQNYYEIQYSATGKVFMKRSLPASVKIQVSSNNSVITFSESGNISAGRTIPVSSRYFQKQVVFSIGTGGVDIRDP